MANGKITKVLKHKRIIIFSLLIVGFLVLIMFIYILTYIDNKPVVFDNEDAKVIKAKDIELFDMDVIATEITYMSGSTNGSIKYYAEITNLSENLENVSVEFELNTNWTNTETAGSTYKFNNGETLRKNPLIVAYPTSVATTSLKYNYPITVLPFVKVKNPNIYAKVTYTRTSSVVPEDLRTETIYVVYTFNDYYKGGKIYR